MIVFCVGVCVCDKTNWISNISVGSWKCLNWTTFEEWYKSIVKKEKKKSVKLDDQRRTELNPTTNFQDKIEY